MSLIRSSSNSNKRPPFLRDQNMAQWVSSLWFTTNRTQPLRFTFSTFILLSKRDALISHHHYVPIELNISYVISKVATSRIRHLLKFTCFIVVWHLFSITQLSTVNAWKYNMITLGIYIFFLFTLNLLALFYDAVLIWKS